jgi:hypothetical protein
LSQNDSEGVSGDPEAESVAESADVPMPGMAGKAAQAAENSSVLSHFTADALDELQMYLRRRRRQVIEEIYKAAQADAGGNPDYLVQPKHVEKGFKTYDMQVAARVAREMQTEPGRDAPQDSGSSHGARLIAVGGALITLGGSGVGVTGQFLGSGWGQVLHAATWGVLASGAGLLASQGFRRRRR